VVAGEETLGFRSCAARRGNGDPRRVGRPHPGPGDRAVDALLSSSSAGRCFPGRGACGSASQCGPDRLGLSGCCCRVRLPRRGLTWARS
jgi:hypothetical protein